MSGSVEPGTGGLDATTRLAVERTYLSHDRTAMSWARTAISLITFGYGLYKVIDSSAAGVTAKHALIGHRELGAIMIGIGVLSLMLGVYEHWQGIRQLQAQYPAAPRHESHVRLLCSAIAVLGFLALMAMLFRV